MRVLVCGGRDYEDHNVIYGVLDGIKAAHGWITIIEGGALGADAIARTWANENYCGVVTVKANWHLHGTAAGPIRNTEMLAKGRPDLVLAFPGGNGLEKGTGDMVRKARAANVRTKVYGYED